jgi:hypothetical protein
MKAIPTSRDVKWLSFVCLDPKCDMSVFTQDPELTDMLMGLDDNKLVYRIYLMLPGTNHETIPTYEIYWTATPKSGENVDFLSTP